MEAQKNKKYYEEKYQAEKAKVDAAEETANLLEQEFKVHSLFYSCVASVECFRHTELVRQSGRIL